MITRFNIFINEGVRDLMTPKSEEEIKQAFSNMIKTFNNPVTDMAPEWQSEFKKLANMLSVPETDLHIIVDDDTRYELMDDYFEDLVTDEKKEVLEIQPEGDFMGGEYRIYPEQKLAYWSSNVHDDPHVWLFSKSHFTKLNESIRDMMTPKSREDILSGLKGDKSVVFKPTSTYDGDDMWISRIGTLDASYSDLVELFGEPNGEVDDYKSSTAWELKDNKGRFVRIGDYKSTRLYDNDTELPTVEEFRKLPSYDWSVSGGRKDSESLVNDLITYVILNII